MSQISCKIKILDEVYAIISGLTRDDHKTLYDKFSFYVEGYKFIPAVQLGRWDRQKELF